MSISVILGLAILAGFTAYMFLVYKRIKNAPEVATHEKILILSEAEFEKNTKTGVVMVDFWAAWCMPCKMMAPVLNEVATEAGNQAKIAKLDVEAYPGIASKFAIRSIPTIIIFKNGQEIKRFVGAKSKDFLLSEIRKAIG